MFKIRKILIGIIVSLSFFFIIRGETFAENCYFVFSCPDPQTAPYCSNIWSCTLLKGLDVVKSMLPGFSNKPISVLAQDIVQYLLGFISIIAVIYIIYAGFQVMIGWGDEEKTKKAKNIITYVVVGIIIMWLAYGIVKWTINLVTGPIWWTTYI